MAKQQHLSSSAEAPGAVGKVEQTDGQTIVVAIGPGIELHHRDFIEVPFQKGNKPHRLIGQIELLVGEDVLIGTTQQQGKISILGINADFGQTKDLKEARLKATARIVAFIDDSANVSEHETTRVYMGKPVFRAEPKHLELIFSSLASSELAPLEVGTLLGTSSAISVVFDPTGFMRHTAIFGQSGSGKSFAFGIVLEELLAKTNARVLVLDPNSDYAKFSSVRSASDVRKHSKRKYSEDEHASFSEIWAKKSKKFLQFSSDLGKDAADRLALLFSDLHRRDQSALLGLDAVNDRDEFSALREIMDSLPADALTISGLMDALLKVPSVEKVRLLYRIKNREVDKMSLWGRSSTIAQLREVDWNFASVDLRQVTAMERSLAAATVLESVYRDVVQSRKMTFIVMDEAHNFCPATPWESHQLAPRQIIHEIAAEGRKYGAFLMLLTQSPSKLSEQALSQCDNIILMKMTSGTEVEALQTVVRDAGPRLAQLAFNLRQGEAICMGGIVRTETGVKFDLRKTMPGGEDLGKQWAKKVSA